MARITIYNIDLLDESIGNFKRWQIKIVVLILLLNVLISSVNIRNLFLVPPFELWSKPGEVLFEEQFFCSSNEGGNVNSCERLSMSDALFNEWDFVEQRTEFTHIAQIVANAGSAVGGLLLGRFADVFGRKFSLIVLLLLQTLSEIVLAIGLSYETFLFFKFVNGVLNAGVFVSSAVLCVEVAGKMYRSYIPAFYQLMFGLTSVVFSVIGSCFHRWREFQLLLAGINLLFLTYFWLLDESPRWLVVNDLRDDVLEALQLASPSQNIHRQIIEEMCLTYKEEPTSISAVFRHKPLKDRAVYLSLIWLILGMLWTSLFTYVGVVFNNPYNYVLITGIELLISSALLGVTGYATGRKLQASAGIYFVTLCFCITWGIGIWDNWASFIFSQLGFLGINVAIPSTYLLTSEMYPTVLRCTGVGLAMVFFYLGLAVVSLMNLISGIALVLPLLVFVVLAFAHCYLHIFLPETKGIVLPNVLSDIRDEDTESEYD